MRVKLVPLLLLMWAVVPATAEESTHKLREALGQMPQIILSNPSGMQAYFLDVPAWRGTMGSDMSSAGLIRLVLAQGIETVRGLQTADALAAWDVKAGLPFDEISYFAGFGSPPMSISYWGLRDSSAAGRLMEALGERGFTPVGGAGSGILGNGAPNAISPKDRDPSDPWRGPLGRSAFVMPIGNAILKAPVPEAMAQLARTDPSAADNAFVAVALDGLDGMLDEDRGTIVQAAVLSPGLGLEQFDPARLLSSAPGDIAAAKAALEAGAADAGKGVPPYFSGILADVDGGDRPVMIVSLAYPECATADAAVAKLESRWTEGPGTSVEAEIDGQSVSTPGGLCAAVVAFAGQAGDADNVVLRQTIDRLMSRNFNLFQIGKAE
jgi:hypothetical protein